MLCHHEYLQFRREQKGHVPKIPENHPILLTWSLSEHVFSTSTGQTFAKLKDDGTTQRNAKRVIHNLNACMLERYACHLIALHKEFSPAVKTVKVL